MTLMQYKNFKNGGIAVKITNVKSECLMLPLKQKCAENSVFFFLKKIF